MAAPKPGRPKRKESEDLRTRAWYNAVRIRSKVSDRALARTFGGGVSGWSRYHQGTTSPTSGRLAAVEEAYPGTLRYYQSPLWDLLDLRNFGWFTMRRAFGWLQEPLRSHFVEPEQEAPHFWRRPTNLIEDLRMLRDGFFSGETLDHTTALAALVLEAATAQSRDGLSLAVEAWAVYLARRHGYTDAISIAPQGQFFEFGLFAYEHVRQEPVMTRSDCIARRIFEPHLRSDA